MIRRAAVALLVVTIVVAVAFATRVPKAATTVPVRSVDLAVGARAPAVKVGTNHGPFDLQTAQTPVLLEVFATWCPHCQRETEIINDLAARYDGVVRIVAVTGSPYAVDGNAPESDADVAAFVSRFGARYDVAFDPSLEVARRYLSAGFPTLTLIGRDHRVVWRAHGEVPEAAIGREFDALLARERSSRGDAAGVPKLHRP